MGISNDACNATKVGRFPRNSNASVIIINANNYPDQIPTECRKDSLRDEKRVVFTRIFEGRHF